MGLLSRRGAFALLLAALASGPVAAQPAAEAPGTPDPGKTPAQTASPDAGARALPSGDEVARRINARDEGRQTSRRLVMDLIDEGGYTRTRETRLFRRREDDGTRKMVLFFESPKNLEGTAFLSHDLPDPDRDDDLWLYLPALRKVRRIASSDRGRSFLATDLSYEDMKLETRVAQDEYRWRTLGAETVDGRRMLEVEAVPIDEATAHELGYGRVQLWVDPEIWMVRRAAYEDPAGRPLKTASIEEVRQVDGIWTPHRIDVRNLRTGHRTLFRFSDVDYQTELPESLFTPQALHRGPP